MIGCIWHGRSFVICFFLYHSAWHVVGIQEVDFCRLAGGKACVLWYLRVWGDFSLGSVKWQIPSLHAQWSSFLLRLWTSQDLCCFLGPQSLNPRHASCKSQNQSQRKMTKFSLWPKCYHFIKGNKSSWQEKLSCLCLASVWHFCCFQNIFSIHDLTHF